MQNIKLYNAILFSFTIVAMLSDVAMAELSYNFSTKQSTNGLTEDAKKTLHSGKTEDNDKYYYNFKQNKIDNDKELNSSTKNTENKEDQIQPTGYANNEVKVNIGGLAEAQYFYTNQPDEYTNDVLPNGLKQSPAEMHNYSIANDNQHILHMLGRIDVVPEFVRYKTDPITNKKQKVLVVGAKISQPFYNASKNTDPRLAPQEYIYLKTKYLQFHVGATNSAAAKMRVDPQSIASGAGGVYGSWWRYVSLPVFNTAGMSPRNANALNAISPTYILYPTLPNEAGFTAQRTALGKQGYPTQGAYSNKISLYTQRIKGFSFGISYSPTTAHTGFITRELNKETEIFKNISGGFIKNYTSVALDYRKQFDRYGFGFAISATYEYGEASPLKQYNNNNGADSVVVLSDTPYYNRHNLNAFSVGAKIVYKNLSLSYSYGYWGHSLLNKYFVMTDGEYQVANQNKRSYYHTAGLGANYGPVRVGATYMHSNFAGYKLDAWSVGTDFKMISLKYLRVQPYFEYLGYIFHTQNIQLITGDNSKYKASASNGFVITLGMRVVF